MITCTRRLQFCSGHRLVGHESKCAHVHGHNYVIFLHARAALEGDSELDAIGRVIDFSVLKEEIGKWIDVAFDHAFVASQEDVDLIKFLQDNEQKHFVLPYNPTAENMAKYIGEEIAPQRMMPYGIEIFKIELWETENCFAVWETEKKIQD